MEATLKASRAVTDYVRTKGPAILQVAKPFPVAAPACVRAPASPQSILDVCICVYVMCVDVCMCTCVLARTHVHTDAYTRARTHTHTYTHTHRIRFAAVSGVDL